MALNSINTNIGAYYAQANIGKASAMASSSIARLSSGNRIVQAKDDVASMAAGTSLQTNVSTLKQALTNTSQGSSLLQVADGALAQMGDILQRQKAIAVQAGSGSLTDTDRAFLNEEFTNLSAELDDLVGQTNFNGVNLLNGATSQTVAASLNTDAAKTGSMSIAFNINNTGAQTLSINGQTVTAGANFAVGGTIAQTLGNLVNYLNGQTNNNAFNSMTYSVNGNSLVITAKNGGSFASDFGVNMNTGTWTKTANAAVINGTGGQSRMNVLTTNGIVAADINTSVVAAAATATQQIKAGNLALKIGAGTTYNVALVAGDTLSTIVQKTNALTNTTGVKARIIGYSGAYNLEFESQYSDYTATGTTDDITATFAGVDTSVTGSASTTTTSTYNYGLFGGSDNGISKGDVVGVGTMGNPILVGQAQARSQLSVILPDIADANLKTATNFGSAIPRTLAITLGSTIKTFAFTNTGTGPQEAAIGGTLSETLDNMVSTLNAFARNGGGTSEENYTLNQVEFYRDGNAIVARSKDYDASTNSIGGVAFLMTGTLPTGATITNAGNLNNGLQTGITTSGVTNKDFIGTLSGFTAQATGANTATMKVKVGDFTYTGSLTNTNPTANTTVRFSSDTVNGKSGGYFDMDFAASQGVNIADYTDTTSANTLAQLTNAAASSITFYQNHEVTSYAGSAPIITDGVSTGTLIGTSFNLQGTSFSDVKIENISVGAPKGSSPNGTFSVTINGDKYNAPTALGRQLAANSVITLTSESDSNKVLTFRTGNAAIQIGTDAKAAAFETALKNAFGVGQAGKAASLNFQVGSTAEDSLKISLDDVSTKSIYKGKSLDVLTAADAAAASVALEDAIHSVTAARSLVGALQSRFDFASANIQSSIQNQDAARGTLLDTDVAAESTAFSQQQVKLQAGIAVLAQANQLPQNLLKLIS